MATTERQQRLTAEYLNSYNVAPVEKQSKRGRVGAGPPPVEPVCPALPVFESRPDDKQDSDSWSIAFNRFSTRGELRGLAHHAAVNEVYRIWNEAHWAWRRAMTIYHQRNKQK